MDLQNRKSFLEIKIIWKDDEMVELQVTASDGNYFGKTEIYDTTESLLDFTKEIEGFPLDFNKSLFYETGNKDGYAYFSMHLYCLDNAGHIGVEINFEENVASNQMRKIKNKIRIEIIVEPVFIDYFQKELTQLANNQMGVATLYGRDNILD